MKKLRVAIIGPESSGKSVLTKALAKKLNWPYVLEYAREYFDTHDYSTCNINDLISIAKEQFKQIHQEPLQQALISDTELFTMEIWAKDKFDYIPDEIEDLRKLQSIDLYILSSPDFEWKYDELRTDAHRRNEIFDMYLKLLQSNNANFITIKGSVNERVKICMNYFEHFVKPL